MLEQPNDGGGTTVILAEGDDLASLPESHRDIITDSAREAFRDPATYFAAIASRTSIPNLSKYLTNAVSEGCWALLLAETFMMDRATIAAFRWSHPAQSACMLGTPDVDCIDGHFAPFYDCLSMAHWDSIGFAGGIVPYHWLMSVDYYATPTTNATFPSEKTVVFGNSSCGDMMVCNSSGTAGYLSHESGESYVIGTFSEMIDWVFGELIHRRTPEFDYSRT